MQSGKVSIVGSNLIASGEKTDADGTDKTIPTAGFNRLIVDCTGATAKMTFTIDEAIAGAAKPIYVKSGRTLDIPVRGSVLHYSGAGVFQYILL